MHELFETFKAVDKVIAATCIIINDYYYYCTTTTSASNLYRYFKYLYYKMNKGMYIDSYRNEISLRLGLISFTKTPQNIRFVFLLLLYKTMV